MNPVVIFLVPMDVTSRDFAAAFQEIHGSKIISEAAKAKTAAEPAKIIDNDQMPLWTWFVSGPRPPV
jgi:hypothetical protein